MNHFNITNAWITSVLGVAEQDPNVLDNIFDVIKDSEKTACLIRIVRNTNNANILNKTINLVSTLDSDTEKMQVLTEVYKMPILDTQCISNVLQIINKIKLRNQTFHASSRYDKIFEGLSENLNTSSEDLTTIYNNYASKKILTNANIDAALITRIYREKEYDLTTKDIRILCSHPNVPFFLLEKIYDSSPQEIKDIILER